MNLVALAILFTGSSLCSALWAFLALDTMPGRNFAVAYVIIFAIIAAAALVSFVAEYVEHKAYQKEASRLGLNRNQRGF